MIINLIDLIMGKKVGIWLDCEKAYIISLFEEKHVVETVESNVETRLRFTGESKSFSGRGGALVNLSKKKTKRKKHQVDQFIVSLAKRISSAEGIFIFGPAETKRELSKVLIRRKDKSSVYVEPADKMTEKQMIARVRKHFLADNSIRK